jgi:uncharacterized protein YeaO (DUF488 family)
LAALSASIALADDFKTIDGKEYKNVTVSRVEPDGVVIKFSGGIVKIPFTELSKELQEKYHYDPGAAQKFAIQTAEEIKAANANAEELRKKAAAERDQQYAASARFGSLVVLGSRERVARVTPLAPGLLVFFIYWRHLAAPRLPPARLV